MGSVNDRSSIMLVTLQRRYARVKPVRSGELQLVRVQQCLHAEPSGHVLRRRELCRPVRGQGEVQGQPDPSAEACENGLAGTSLGICDARGRCLLRSEETSPGNLSIMICPANPRGSRGGLLKYFITITGVRTCRWPWSARTPVRCSRLSRVRSSLSRTWVDCITILRGWLHDVRGRELHRNAQYAFSGRTTPRGDTPAPISSGRQSSARRLRRPPASRARGDRQSSRCRS